MPRDCPQNSYKGKGHNKGFKGYQSGGKKGFGKGAWNGKGKGLNTVAENYGSDYDYYGYEETSWPEAFCCLKVKENKGSWETPKKTVKFEKCLEKAEVDETTNMFEILGTYTEDEKEEENKKSIEAPKVNKKSIEVSKVNKKPIEVSKVRNKMPRVGRWKKIEEEKEKHGNTQETEKEQNKKDTQNGNKKREAEK